MESSLNIRNKKGHPGASLSAPQFESFLRQVHSNQSESFASRRDPGYKFFFFLIYLSWSPDTPGTEVDFKISQNQQGMT